MREELLRIIEKNSRMDLKELAVILGVEEVDVVNELAALEAEGIICGYHTMINWENTNIEKVNALIEVRITPQRGQGFDSFAERIYKYAEVNSVYLIGRRAEHRYPFCLKEIQGPRHHFNQQIRR